MGEHDDRPLLRVRVRVRVSVRVRVRVRVRVSVSVSVPVARDVGQECGQGGRMRRVVAAHVEHLREDAEDAWWPLALAASELAVARPSQRIELGRLVACACVEALCPGVQLSDGTVQPRGHFLQQRRDLLYVRLLVSHGGGAPGHDLQAVQLGLQAVQPLHVGHCRLQMQKLRAAVHAHKLLRVRVRVRARVRVRVRVRVSYP